MKQEYGAWLVKQQQKKKRGIGKRTLIVAGAVLVVTTTSFGISQWISHKSNVEQPPLQEYNLRRTDEAAPKPISTVAYAGKDSFTTTTETPFLHKDPVGNEPVRKETKQTTAAKKERPVTEKNPAPQPADTATMAIAPPPPLKEEKAAPEVPKKTVALSRLVSVSGTWTEENKTGATNVTLQNNSSEVLKSVSVIITYYKKNERPVGKETVYFYDVQPATAPVIKANGNRKAVSFHLQIGAITRADGSLYLIH
jgi:hypothetical protein